MSIQIKLKNSVVQDSTPSTSDLPAVGEIALNANINSIGGFMRASNNTIVKIFGPGSLTTPTATTTVSGISELATNTETTAGSATNRVVTPAGLNAVTVAERTTSNNNYVAKAGSTMTGVLTATAGSNSAPAINFGDSDSGIFGGTNTVSLAAGGTTRLTADTGVSVVGTLAVTGAITSTSDLTIADKIIHSGDPNTAIRFPTADTVSIEVNGSEALRVNSAKRLLVGTSSPVAIAGVNSIFQVEGTSVGDSSLSLNRNSSDNQPPFICFGKTRGSSIGSTTVIQENDVLGAIRFAGADGTDLGSFAAQIKVEVDGPPGSNDIPGRMIFSTTADGAASATERLRIDAAGVVKVAGALETTNGAITANVGTNNQVIIGGDGAIEISRNGGGAFIDFKNDPSEDQDARIQENSGGFDLSGTVNIGNNLNVTGITQASQFKLLDNAKAIYGTGGDMEIFHNATNSLIQNGTGALQIVNNAANQMILLKTGTGGNVQFNTNGSNTAAMTLYSNGNLALGHTGSGTRLSVQGPGGTNNIPFDWRGGTGRKLGYLYSDATSVAIVASDDSVNKTSIFLTEDTRIDFRVNGSERMRITDIGRLGIGTSSPSEKLEAVGNIRATTSGSDDSVIVSANGSIEMLRSGGAFIDFKDATEDHDCRIKQESNGLAFTTGGQGSATEKMRILSNGRIGIGLSSATVKLHQHESSSAANYHQFTNSTTGSGGGDGAIVGIDANEALIIWNQENNPVRFATNNSERMRISNAGTVGISTSSPDSNFKLDVNGAIRVGNTTDGIIIENSTQNPNTANACRIHRNGSTGALNFTAGTTTARDMIFNTKTSAGESMRIDSNGNVGIGTNNPVAKLDVESPLLGTSSGNQQDLIRIKSPDVSNDTRYLFRNFRFQDGSGHTSSELRFFRKVDVTDMGYLGLRDGSITFGYGSSEKMRMRSDGNFGINVSNPTQKLHIDGNILLANSKNLYFGDTGTKIDGVAGGNISFMTGSALRMYLDNSGRLKINTTTSTGPKLIVNQAGDHTLSTSGNMTNGFFLGMAGTGSAAFNMGTDGTDTNFNSAFANNAGVARGYKFRTGGTVRLTISTGGTVSGDLNDTSDEKLKKNIISIADGVINKIKQLRPVNFDWKEEKEDSKGHSGFIAQEIKTIIPDLVEGTEYDENTESTGYSVNTYGLVAYLTKALQETISKVEILENKVSTLEGA